MRLRFAFLLLAIVTCPFTFWSLSSAQAPVDTAALVQKSADESPLKTLDWLVGHWSSTQGQTSVEFSCHFTKNDTFLIRSFTVTTSASPSPTSGMQIIAWDPAQSQLRSWTYDSQGGFGEDTWTQNRNRYTLRSTHTFSDGGKASMLNVATFIDNDHFSWKSVQREIDGDLQPDVEEIVFVRTSAIENKAGEK